MARVALILRPDRGGAFHHVRQLCQALSQTGHEAVLLGPHAGRADVEAEIVPIDIGREISAAGDARAVAAFAREVRRLRPDIVHAHGSKGGVIARVARIANPRVPVVFTPHLYAFDNYFAEPAQRTAYRVIERTLAPLASRVIGVCESERLLAARIGPAAKTRTVHNGVAPVAIDEIHPRVAELRDHGPVVCAVAELRESKGVDILVEAMVAVHGAVPNASLVVAGDGNERVALDRRIAELGLERVITMLGATRGPDSVLAGSNLFVNPAFAEAFPYTVIEAMSAGLPVVATDVGGTREAIGGRPCGILVEPHDADGLARAIIDVLSDSDLAQRLGSAGAIEHAERFTTERMISGIFSVYAEVSPAFAAPSNIAG